MSASLATATKSETSANRDASSTTAAVGLPRWRVSLIPDRHLTTLQDRFERERDALAPSITHVNSNYGDALSLKPALISAATFGFIHHEYIRI